MKYLLLLPTDPACTKCPNSSMEELSSCIEESLKTLDLFDIKLTSSPPGAVP